jgi:hypothetical protein
LEDPGHKIPPQLLWLIIAMIGGVAKLLHQYIQNDAPIAIAKLLAQAVVSGFCGYLVAEVVQQISPRWAFVAAGTAGFVGAQILEPLINGVLRGLRKWTDG